MNCPDKRIHHLWTVLVIAGYVPWCALFEILGSGTRKRLLVHVNMFLSVKLFAQYKGNTADSGMIIESYSALGTWLQMLNIILCQCQ